MPGYDASGWFGICAPAATPPAIVDKLNAEINAIVADAGHATRASSTSAFGRCR